MKVEKRQFDSTNSNFTIEDNCLETTVDAYTRNFILKITANIAVCNFYFKITDQRYLAINSELITPKFTDWIAASYFPIVRYFANTSSGEIIGHCVVRNNHLTLSTTLSSSHLNQYIHIHNFVTRINNWY